MNTQKCPLLKANDYQRGFNAGLLFTGFRNGQIFWMGDDKQFTKYEQYGKA
jgi:hypothetical protein